MINCWLLQIVYWNLLRFKKSGQEWIDSDKYTALTSLHGLFCFILFHLFWWGFKLFRPPHWMESIDPVLLHSTPLPLRFSILTRTYAQSNSYTLVVNQEITEFIFHIHTNFCNLDLNGFYYVWSNVSLFHTMYIMRYVMKHAPAPVYYLGLSSACSPFIVFFFHASSLLFIATSLTCTNTTGDHMHPHLGWGCIQLNRFDSFKTLCNPELWWSGVIALTDSVLLCLLLGDILTPSTTYLICICTICCKNVPILRKRTSYIRQMICSSFIYGSIAVGPLFSSLAQQCVMHNNPNTSMLFISLPFFKTILTM